jgi:hypothetical protein
VNNALEDYRRPAAAQSTGRIGGPAPRRGTVTAALGLTAVRRSRHELPKLEAGVGEISEPPAAKRPPIGEDTSAHRSLRCR